MSDQDFETVASLIARLGQPPPDIAKQWIDDARAHVDSHDVPPLDSEAPLWQQMVVNEFGRVTLPPESETRPWSDTHRLDPPSESSSISVEVDSGFTIGGNRRSRAASAQRRWNKPMLIASGIAAVLIVTFAFALREPPTTDETSTAIAETDRAPRNDPFSPGLIDDPEARSHSAPAHRDTSAEAELATMMDPTDTLEPAVSTVQSIATTSGESTTSAILPASFSLDVAMPPTMAQSDESSPPDGARVDVASIDITETRDDDEALDEAVPQATAASAPPQPQTTAVTLPNPPNRDAELPPPMVLLAAPSAPSRLQLEFPTETPLQLRFEQDTWRVITGDDATAIGSFQWRRDEDGNGAVQFRWLAAAADSPLADSLAHGRITTAEGHVVYLRPQLDGQAILTDLGERDEKLKWMLSGSTLTKVTRLQLNLRVPDDVAVQWIEPIDETSSQRTRGIAVFTLKDAADSGAVAARIDLRTAGALSIRLRYGARLGPGMPWQWTDAESIRAALDTATEQLQLADERLLQIETAISRSKKLRERRRVIALEIQRDGIEQAVQRGTFVAKRLAELDQLVALLGAGGQINVNLYIPWPDGTVQTLLTLSESSRM